MTTCPRLLPVSLVALVAAQVWVYAQTTPAPPPVQASAAVALAPTPEQAFKGDAHDKAKLTCAACHGDGSTPAPIEREKIAPLCAKCHSDAAYMQRFVPADKKARADQFALYQTTTHGKQMAKGETRVATCTDCHRSHGVLPATETNSSVAPRNVAATCARCHSEKTRMEAFQHFGNPPEDWTKSVHAAALVKDSSSPTCSTCHSAHGVMLEGAKSLQMVCVECHARQGDLYLKSPHKKAFDEMDQPGCITCHSNHEIVPPGESMIGIDDPGICGTCHDDKTKGRAAILEVRQKLDVLGAGIVRARTVLDRAEEAGMLVDEARLDLREAVQQQILSRVAFHTFQTKPVLDPADKGLAAAAKAEKAGHDALAELQHRRRGLAVATFFILGFLVTLWIKIRRLPHPPA